MCASHACPLALTTADWWTPRRIPIAVFLMLLSAFLNRYTLLLNLSVCNRSGCDPGTAAIGEKAF